MNLPPYADHVGWWLFRGVIFVGFGAALLWARIAGYTVWPAALAIGAVLFMVLILPALVNPPADPNTPEGS